MQSHTISTDRFNAGTAWFHALVVADEDNGRVMYTGIKMVMPSTYTDHFTVAQHKSATKRSILQHELISSSAVQLYQKYCHVLNPDASP